MMHNRDIDHLVDKQLRNLNGPTSSLDHERRHMRNDRKATDHADELQLRNLHSLLHQQDRRKNSTKCIITSKTSQQLAPKKE